MKKILFVVLAAVLSTACYEKNGWDCEDVGIATGNAAWNGYEVCVPRTEAVICVE
jgi:hypothetical protein